MIALIELSLNHYLLLENKHLHSKAALVYAQLTGPLQ